MMSAMAGIDQALWDIAGKTLGVPVHRMLGGAVRTRLRAYRWCGGDDNSPAEAAAEAKRVVSTGRQPHLFQRRSPRQSLTALAKPQRTCAATTGWKLLPQSLPCWPFVPRRRAAACQTHINPFRQPTQTRTHTEPPLLMHLFLRCARMQVDTSNYKQLKMNACSRMGYIDTDAAVEAAAARLKAVREAVGPDIGVGLDFHGRVKMPMVKKLMAALEPHNPLFYEEVLVSGQNDGYAKVVAPHTTVPIATGERMYTTEQFRDLFETRAVNIIQPDCSHAGGISQMLTLARMAEAYEVAFAPHCPLGPIALAACLQVDACALNFVFQETSLGIHYNTEGGMDLLDYVADKSVFAVDDEGFLSLPTAPGLGIEIDEAAVRKAAATSHNWRDREWTLPDGAPTTW